jgi:uncharacterized protein (DUF305 family)
MAPRYAQVCALISALLLAGCGGSDSQAGLAQAPPTQQAQVSQQEETTLAADLRPLHAEAVELADLLLAAAPSPAVANVATRLRQQQADLLAEADRVLATTGASPAENAALAAQELDAARTAVGDQAVELGLDGLFRNHLAAVSRAKQEVVERTDGSGRALADRVLAVQGPMLEELTALPQ